MKIVRRILGVVICVGAGLGAAAPAMAATEPTDVAPVAVVQAGPSTPDPVTGLSAVPYASDLVAPAGDVTVAAEGKCPYSGTHPTISKGSAQAAVVAHAQCLLRNYHGFTSLAVDGIFGDGTRGAVISFQAAQGLVADGVIGPLTWDALHP